MTDNENEIIVENNASKHVNPLLQRINKMPPESFKLPSGGIYYNNGELDDEVVNGELLIYPMTTIDEITMKSTDLLYNGEAVERVFLRCIPQVKKPKQLLSNDVDFLMICLRVVTYGNNMDIYWNCPKCAETEKKNKEEHDNNEKKEDVTIDGIDNIDEIRTDINRGDSNLEESINVRPIKSIDLNQFIKKVRPLNTQKKNDFIVKLSTGEVVQLRPTKFEEMIKLFQYDIDQLKSPDELVDFIVDNIAAVVDTIDGHANKDDIREWAKQCSAPVLNELREKTSSANDWGTSFEYELKCEKCNYVNKTEIPLNPLHFFTKPSVAQTKI
jgi:hypothetical protein